MPTLNASSQQPRGVDRIARSDFAASERVETLNVFEDILAPEAPSDAGNKPFPAFSTWTRWEKKHSEILRPCYNALPDFLFQTDKLSSMNQLALCKKVQEGGAEGEEAKQKIIECNLRLVHHFARRYARLATPGVDFEDIFQEGVKGLSRAIDFYDPLQYPNSSFSTYAGSHIRLAILTAVSHIGDTVYSPDRYRRIAWAALRAAEVLTQQLGRDPTYAEVAERVSTTHRSLQISPRVIELLFAQGFLLPAPPSEHFEQDHLDHWIPAHQSQQSATAYQDDTLTIFSRAFQECSADFKPRVREILALRYPLDPEQLPKTLEEVGAIYGFSKQRVHQIEQQAFEKLRRRLTRRGLAPEAG